MSGTNFSQYLSDLQEKKQRLLSFANKAVEFGWISKSVDPTSNSVISLQEIKEKLEKDTLTIGVIGQMKCGKSTFLNSFIFEKDILPAATTPMTAALSVITYGEKERIVAEFYTADEWAEQKMQAARSLEDAAGTLDESKIQAAKELVEKAAKLGTSLNGLLGQTQEDHFDNLIEYVGAEGKYISITKSVTIYYPKEYLKGVEIVDTPGFNDPIVSREERTKEFLKKADVVLMMLYAGRPFDATDRDIIFKNVRQCGIGKVLVGINKYDLPYCNESNPEDENQIKDYVKSEIKKACRDCDDDTLIEILREVEPIPISAEMALLSELPMDKICSKEEYAHAWQRHCLNFEISTQNEMRQKSHLDDLVNAVKTMVNKEKTKILFAKPINAIFAVGDKLKSDIENELTLINSKIELFSMSDDEVEEKKKNLTKIHRRLSKKIDSLGADVEADIQNIIRKGNNDLEDIVDNTCKRMKNIIHNEWSRFKSYESIKPRVDGEMQKLQTRDLKRATMALTDEAKQKIKRCIDDFFSDAEDLLMRFLPDFDSRSFIKSLQHKIQIEIESKELFTFNQSVEDENCGLDEMLFEVVNCIYLGGLKIADNILSHSSQVAERENMINKISNEFDAKPYLNTAFKNIDKIIEAIKQALISDLIEPLQEQIQEIQSKIDEKEHELKSCETQRTLLEEKKTLISKQLEEISHMKSLLL